MSDRVDGAMPTQEGGDMQRTASAVYTRPELQRFGSFRDLTAQFDELLPRAGPTGLTTWPLLQMDPLRAS